MKVCFVTHFSNLYGANRTMLDTIVELERRGVACCVLLRYAGQLAGKLEAMGVEYAILPMRGWHHKKQNPLRTLAHALRNQALNRIMLGRTLRQCEKWGVDLVYSNSVTVQCGALIAARAKLPHVWHVREFGDLDYGLYPDLGKAKLLAMLKRADRVVCISHSICRHYGLEQNPNSVVIYNGPACGDEPLNWAVGDRPKFTFLMVGLIHEPKGQFMVLEAYKKFRRRAGLLARLVFVGGGQVEALRRRIHEAGLEGELHLAGKVDDVEEHYLEADCLLMGSENEAFGRVTVEAMAHGLPVIGYDSAGTAEIVEHERTGLLYKDEAELVSHMTRLAADRDEAKRLGLAGRKSAFESFSRERYGREIYEIVMGLEK